jgi:hypothetical protein
MWILCLVYLRYYIRIFILKLHCGLNVDKYSETPF